MRTNWAPLPEALDIPARRLVEELRASKDKSGLTLAELSNRTHYSTSSWERWLNGKRLIPRAALQAFAEAAGADLEQLLALLEQTDQSSDSATRPAPQTASTAGPDNAADPGPTTEPDPTEAASARGPKPAELPRDVPDYVGRERELDALVAGLREPARTSPPIWGVVGMGGLGKTSFAVRAAHRVAAAYPDGTLFLDLRGGSALPLAVDAALLRLLRSMGVADAAIPAGVDDRSALLRSTLARRRVLMVLDNASDAAQIRPLLPGDARCAAIITSRNQLAGLEGLQRLALDSLSPDDSRALLTRIAGDERFAAEPDAGDQVISFCAGLPLALRIAASRLAVRPAWGVQTLSRQLQSAADTLDELSVDDLAVRTCFEASYDTLMIDGVELGEVRAFRLLGLWEGAEISLPAAAALLDTDLDAADRELERLTDISLLQSPAPKRYRFHDLLRSFAATRAQQELEAADRRSAIGRLAAWYAHTAAEATALIYQGIRNYDLSDVPRPAHVLSFQTPEEAMEWYDSEDGGLVSITRQAQSTHLDEIAAMLPQIFHPYHETRFKIDEWVDTVSNGLISARRSGATLVEAHLQMALATAYGHAGLQDETMNYSRSSMELYERFGDQLNQARAMSRLARAHELAGNIDEALSWLVRATDLFESSGYDYGVADNLNRLGMICNGNGLAQEAVVHLERGLVVAERLGTVIGQAATISNLGQAYLNLREFEKARAALATADRMLDEIGFERGKATNTVMMGILARETGQLAEASEHWNRALATFEEIGHPHAEEVRQMLVELGAAGVAG